MSLPALLTGVLFNAKSARAQTWTPVPTNIYEECVDEIEACEPSWSRCNTEDNFYNQCCFSCHSVIVSDVEAASCAAINYDDVLTPMECALAAQRNQKKFRELRVVAVQDNRPLGCFLSANGDEFFWNPALFTGYDPIANGWARICLSNQRPTSSLRRFTPIAVEGIGRVEMDIPVLDDVNDQFRFIENGFTCDDAKCDGLVSDENTCIEVAHKEELPFESNNDDYSPGGCFYDGGSMKWNRGGTFPPKYDRLLYSHVCGGCHRDACPIPAWMWIMFSLFILILLLIVAAACCYNYQRMKGVDMFRRSPDDGIVQRSQNLGEQQPFNSPEAGGRRAPPSGGPDMGQSPFNFPLRPSDNIGADVNVPMILFNRPNR